MDSEAGFAYDQRWGALALGDGVLRFVVRLIALGLLAGAFAAAVIDGARSLADQQVVLTSMGQTLGLVIPSRMAILPQQVARLSPWLWDPVLISILYVPAFIDLAVVGLVLMALCRPRGARER